MGDESTHSVELSPAQRQFADAGNAAAARLRQLGGVALVLLNGGGMRLIAVVVLLHGALAHAEGVRINLEVPAVTPQLTESAEHLERAGRAERLTGIIVTSIGILAAGVAVFGFSVAANANPDSDAVIAGKAYGILGTLVAGLHLGVGIPLWIDGSRRIDAANQLHAGQLSLAPAPAGSIGAGIGVSF